MKLRTSRKIKLALFSYMRRPGTQAARDGIHLVPVNKRVATA
jgi:hypothetical protein